MSGFDCEVAIIGYGPSGVSAANFLGSRGVRVIALEREEAIYPRARAVTINDWTMRCYQSVGLDAQLKTVMEETFALRWVTYDGRVVNRVDFGSGRFGHAPSYSIYQPAMEEILRAGAARFDNVDVRFGVAVADVAQDADGVTLTLSDGAAVRARYALACDGGSSLTRERLGIRMLGDTLETRWVVIDARVKRWWPDRHILTFWSDRRRPVVDIALSMGNHRWELPLRPHEIDADFQTHAQLWALLEPMGVSPDDVEIHRHAFYNHHVRQAEHWRQGRVLLMGDAAHLMPPWAGQGMQSGIRDAHNLAWKLAGALAGRLPDAILDTYQAEREPFVMRDTMLSIGLGRLIRQELSEAEQAAMRASPIGDAPPSSPMQAPPAIAKGWLTGIGGAVGQLMPQPRVAATNGRLAQLDDMLGAGIALLGDGIDPRDALTGAERAAWDSLGASYRAVRPPSRPSEHPSDIIDIDGALIDWLRANGARVVAVRPDFFVAASDVTGLAVPECGGRQGGAPRPMTD